MVARTCCPRACRELIEPWRRNETIPTWDVLHTYQNDYKVIIVGDASMAPYEVVSVGGSVEYMNREAGVTWMGRLKEEVIRFS